MRKLISFALKNKWIHNKLRRLYNEGLIQAKATLPISSSVSEARPLKTRPSTISDFRINLILPALSTEHVFGGIATALSFLTEMAKHSTNIRIVLTDQAAFSHADNPSYNEWLICDLKDDDVGGLRIIPAANRENETLAVGKNDYFIATAWWTAVLTKGIQDGQKKMYGLKQKNRYIYLIQDYEPGFYAWSSQYALAESTYRKSENFIAIFNTSILRNFFLEEGYHFPRAFHFEPVLHAKLKKYLLEPIAHREKKILIYGRPNVPRNAFPIIVMALREWIAKTSATGWSFCSAGEVHAPIDLGNGNSLVSLGKLSIDDYARELMSSFAGISLMISPHPSYPPLEMAAFGVNVITNCYKSKDLSSLSQKIHSIPWASPQELCQMLEEIAASYTSDNIASGLEQRPTSEFFMHFCSDVEPFSLIIDKVLADLKSQDSATRSLSQ